MIRFTCSKAVMMLLSLGYILSSTSAGHWLSVLKCSIFSRILVILFAALAFASKTRANAGLDTMMTNLGEPSSAEPYLAAFYDTYVTSYVKGIVRLFLPILEH